MKERLSNESQGTPGESCMIHSFNEKDFEPSRVPSYIKFYYKETNKKTGEIYYTFSDHYKLDTEDHMKNKKEDEFYKYESIENENFKMPK